MNDLEISWEVQDVLGTVDQIQNITFDEFIEAVYNRPDLAAELSTVVKKVRSCKS